MFKWLSAVGFLLACSVAISASAQDTNDCVIFEWLNTYQCGDDNAGTCTGFRFTNNCEWGVYTSWTDNSKDWPLCREYDDGRSMKPGESGEGVVWFTEDPQLWACSEPWYTNTDHPDWGTCGDHPDCEAMEALTSE